MSGILTKGERRFILKIASTELYSVPLSAEELEEYLAREKVGGTVYYCELVPLIDVSLVVDWDKALSKLGDGLNADESECHSYRAECKAEEGAGSDPTDIDAGKGGESEEEGSSVRSEADGVSGVIGDGGEGGSGGFVGELSDAEFEKLLDVSSYNK